MSAYDTRVLSRARKKIEESIGSHAETVVNGALPDIEKYRELVGVIRGLRMAADLITEAAKDENERDKLSG